MPARPARRFIMFVIPAMVLVTTAAVGLTMLLAPREPAPGGRSGASPTPVTAVVNDFENGSTQDWEPRADGTVRNSTAAAHRGKRSLAVRGRAGGPRPSLNVRRKMQTGAGYTLSVWARMAAGAPATPIRMGIQWTASGVRDDAVVAVATVTSDGWVHLQGTHTLAGTVDSLTVYVESARDTLSFFIDDFNLSYTSAAPMRTDVPALKNVYADSFAMGAAVDLPEISGEHAALLTKHFNSITPFKAMKWATTEPTEGTFDFNDSDAIVKFAVANGIKVRGHTLVWHRQAPSWIFQDAAGNPMTPTPDNKALLLSRLENHIKTLVGRYKGEIYAWDVVNEVLAEDGSMRNSPWYQIAGLDYIKDAFITAHAADPVAELCINDFSLTNVAKRDAMYNLVEQLRAEGVPVTCIGSQMHVNIKSPTAAEVAASIDKFAGLGIDQQITEMDMSVYTDDTSSYGTISDALLADQADAYKALFQVYQSRRAKISSVTLWGLADDDTWLSSYPIDRTDAPLLFDERLRPKPAFWATVAAADALPAKTRRP